MTIGRAVLAKQPQEERRTVRRTEGVRTTPADSPYLRKLAPLATLASLVKISGPIFFKLFLYLFIFRIFFSRKVYNILYRSTALADHMEEIEERNLAPSGSEAQEIFR